MTMNRSPRGGNGQAARPAQPCLHRDDAGGPRVLVRRSISEISSAVGAQESQARTGLLRVVGPAIHISNNKQARDQAAFDRLSQAFAGELLARPQAQLRCGDIDLTQVLLTAQFA